MAEVRRGSLQQGEWGLADVYGGWRVTQQKAWRTIKRQDAHHEDHHATKYRGFRNQSRCRRSDIRSDQDSHSEALLCTFYNHKISQRVIWEDKNGKFNDISLHFLVLKNTLQLGSETWVAHRDFKRGGASFQQLKAQSWNCLVCVCV